MHWSRNCTWSQLVPNADAPLKETHPKLVSCLLTCTDQGAECNHIRLHALIFHGGKTLAFCSFRVLFLYQVNSLLCKMISKRYPYCRVPLNICISIHDSCGLEAWFVSPIYEVKLLRVFPKIYLSLWFNVFRHMSRCFLPFLDSQNCKSDSCNLHIIIAIHCC